MLPLETALLQSSTLEVRLINLGCITQSLRMAHWDADRSAVLGYHDATAYLSNPHYLGAVVGRVANRIEGAQFSLGEQIYRINANEGANTLHGGAGGLSTRVWSMEQDGDTAVQFRLVSEDGDQGFPARVVFTVTVSLHGNELTYDMRAKVDAPTPINMTQHNYYNLGTSKRVDGHHLTLPATEVLATDARGIPTQRKTIANGPMDFSNGRPFETAKHAGLDANYCLAETDNSLIKIHKNTTRLQVNTNQAGLQVYTAGKLNDTAQPFGSQSHGAFSGICLEPQGFPNAVNRPDFPPTIVTPDTPYQNKVTVTLTDDSAL